MDRDARTAHPLATGREPASLLAARFAAAHRQGSQRRPVRYLVVIESGGSSLARLLLDSFEPVSEFDATADDPEPMTAGLFASNGAGGAQWGGALAGHSAAERNAADIYTLDALTSKARCRGMACVSCTPCSGIWHAVRLRSGQWLGTRISQRRRKGAKSAQTGRVPGVRHRASAARGPGGPSPDSPHRHGGSVDRLHMGVRCPQCNLWPHLYPHVVRRGRQTAACPIPGLRRRSSGRTATPPGAAKRCPGGESGRLSGFRKTQ